MPDLVGSPLQSAQDRIQRLTNFAIAVTTSHDATGAGRHQVWDRNWMSELWVVWVCVRIADSSNYVGVRAVTVRATG
jgi:hypothetical protein